MLSLTAVGGFSYDLSEGGTLDPSSFVARLTDSTGVHAPTDYSVTVDWGDGTSSPGVVGPGGGTPAADVLFLIDTTGSMGGTIAAMKTAFGNIATAIRDALPGVDV